MKYVVLLALFVGCTPVGNSQPECVEWANSEYEVLECTSFSSGVCFEYRKRVRVERCCVHYKDAGVQ